MNGGDEIRTAILEAFPFYRDSPGAVREGMDGISPRYIINRLSGALVRDNITCINPIDALRHE